MYYTSKQYDKPDKIHNITAERGAVRKYPQITYYN